MSSLTRLTAEAINKQLSFDAINILFEHKIKNTYFPLLLHIEQVFITNDIQYSHNKLKNVLQLFIDLFPQFIKISEMETDISYEFDYINHIVTFENDSITNLFPNKSILKISTIMINDFNINSQLIEFFVSQGISLLDINKACVIKKLNE